MPHKQARSLAAVPGVTLRPTARHFFPLRQVAHVDARRLSRREVSIERELERVDTIGTGASIELRVNSLSTPRIVVYGRTDEHARCHGVSVTVRCGRTRNRLKRS